MRLLIISAGMLALAGCGPAAPPAGPDPATEASATPERPAPPRTEAKMLARTAILFDQFDRDGDDVLTAVELSAAEAEGARGLRRLRRADANADDRVTIEEAEAVARARFARMDADGDGEVSDDERPSWRRQPQE